MTATDNPVGISLRDSVASDCADTEGPSPRDTARAVWLAHQALVELAVRNAQERDARVRRLMRWTLGDRAAAEAAEAATSTGVEP